MSEKKTGGPAFPVNLNPGERWTAEGDEHGMTLRDYFAAKAMQGLIERGFADLGNSASAYASLAYEYADAMLKAREK